MVFLRSFQPQEGEPRIASRTHYLRPPVMGDFPAWARLREDSRNFLQPWEPIWPADDLTRAAFRRRLRRYAEEWRDGRTLPLFLFQAGSDRLLGGLTVSNIRRGVSQAATLGYWMGAPNAGQGHMSAGVRLILPYCFDTLGLNRVEAACLPSNGPSIHLLEKAGFQREGYARNYLLINGLWQDHILFACQRQDHLDALSNRPYSVGGNLKDIL
ncbi:GNAT family N-acetyltransferase [Roseibium aestuarii]|uniref:GNAT family N-acetyltransferase n=1 Tax=Roseibium aestuarii TaxID=2600299 RepID=A0ABW4JX61_9HYPH|nr:GNAT family protein [Roseibium aestuarii]